MTGVRATFGRLTALRTAAVVLSLVALAGCYRQQMAKQPGHHNPDQPSDFFPDGQANRPLVDGTVARGHLEDDPLRFTGKAGDQFATEFPFEITPAIMTRGHERFDVYCAACHGRVGRGDGKVVQRGYIKPPTYHQPRLRDMPVGQIFDTITHGHGAMPDYASQIPPDDRWAIIAYVRALQFSQGVPADKLTPEDKQRLEDAKRAR